MADFIADGKPFENPQGAADEVYAATPPTSGEGLGALAATSSMLNQTAPQSLSRFVAQSEYGGWGGNNSFASIIGRAAAVAGETEPGVVIPAATQAQLPGMAVMPAPMEDAASVNARAPEGPDGKPAHITDVPMPKPVADMAIEARAAQIQRDGVIARFQNAHSGPTNFLAGTAAFLMDPLNAATTFLPGFGEEAVLARLGTGFLARTAARVVGGATAGAVAQAPLTALRYGLGQEEASDYSLRDAFTDLAFSAAGGAFVHAGLGALGDVLGRRTGEAPGAQVGAAPEAAGMLGIADATSVRAAPEAIGAVIKDAAMRSAVSQIADGRPVDVEPFFAAAVLGGKTRTLSDLSSEDAAMMREPAQDAGLNGDLEILRGNAAQPRPAQSLMSAFRALGPMKDEQGELSSLGINSRSAPGLVSRNGRSLDDVALDLHEQGWLGTPGGERPSISDLLTALYDEQHGSPRIHPSDAAAVEHAQSIKELDAALYDRGLDLRTMSNREVERALNGETAPSTTPADHAEPSAVPRMMSENAGAQGTVDLAGLAARQRALYRDGYAPGMSDDEFRQAEDAIYGKPETVTPARAPALSRAETTIEINGERRTVSAEWNPADVAAGQRSGGMPREAGLEGARVMSPLDRELAAAEASLSSEHLATLMPEERAALDATARGMRDADDRASAYEEAGSCLGGAA